jgi:hypothetical protein
MARIRTIKPGFFRNLELFEAERETGLPLRIAFAGLWTVADREGRFKWEPRALKLDCLPYDEVDFSRVLDALTTRGFVVAYTVDGRQYGYIPTFGRHQVINNREAASDLPNPNEANTLTRAPRVDDACPTPLVQDSGEGKGREGNSIPPSAGAAAPPSDPKKELFARARQVLGRESGGLTAKLLRSCGPDEDDPKTIAKARARIEDASTKNDAAEWLGRVLSPRKGAPVLTDAGTPWPDGQL